ncbi:uncharacterized protein LOC124162171 isoform X2 [Ischnura elegans]|uniref:uncharacterized protein LOC124162171 isoform X2 n=1 Tax=Ischnura elegans TaxID=197161 RepID=UPI001ED87F50|nr:uncharacterized protein LOC124162171 isoform X2 [Ischnura elegans]
MRLVPPRLQMEYNLLAPYTSSRVRTVRLVRSVGTPVTSSAVFGFSIRGGREHGTGFFVSEVGSDARSAGLRVGDQIVRINGYSVEHAIHQEVLKLIQDSNHLNLKVRSVGMIPVKEDDDGIETTPEDDTLSPLNSLAPTSPTKSDIHISLIPTPSKKMIRKNTPPVLTMTEMAAIKKMDIGEIRKPFQPNLETIPADVESPSEQTDRRCDPLTWKMVAAEEESVTPPSPSTTPTLDSLDQPELRNMSSDGGIDAHRDIIQYLNIVGRSKLDCCICKGPEWRPGIFIQSTKEGGFAREAGLRPGDQIVECNGINFEDISFSDAVNALKKDKNLNLVIRKGSGTDLFPGESSGYNSSASSINGDGSTSGHSPNGMCQGWSDDGTKRLSVVREEVSDMNATTGMLGNAIPQSSEGRVAIDKSKDWDEIEYEWELADKQLNPNNVNKEPRTSVPNHFDGREPGVMIGEEDSINEVSVEVKTVAMVHRTEEDETDHGAWNRRDSTVEETQIQETTSHTVSSHNTLIKTTSSASGASMLTSVSLSSALTEEIQRRAKRLGSSDNGCSDGTMKRKNQSRDEGNAAKKDLLKEIADEKRMQHSKLMEEFKKAHSKMFANSLSSGSYSDQPKDSENEVQERHPGNVHHNGSLERRDLSSSSGKSVEDDQSESIPSNTESTEAADQNEPSSSSVPPPPPPMPSLENTNGKIGRINSSPSFPLPAANKQTSYVRVHSLESASPNSPKSPFFANENNIQIIKSEKSAQLSQKQAPAHQSKAPVSVTISEYPSSSVRRAQPTRFDFLPANKTSVKNSMDTSKDLKQPKDWNNVSSQLQSELIQTLSRSKLKAQTETPTDDKKQSSKTFIVGNDDSNRSSKENGCAGMDFMPAKQNGVVSRYLNQVNGTEKPSSETLHPRSPSGMTFQNTEKILNALANKVTIRIPNNSANSVTKHP